MKSILVRLFVGVALAALATVLWRSLEEMGRINRLALQTQQAMLGDAARLPALYTQLEQEARQDCRFYWQAGLAAGRLGNPAGQQAAWSALIECDAPAALRLVRAGARDNRELAEQAAQRHPDQAGNWLWLADILANENQPDQAIAYYQQGLKLAPVNGLAWCRLGSLLYARDPDQAKTAYLNCCHMGDPGSNGCFNAGRIEQERGNVDLAIEYYRLSHWSEAQRRADELEKGLTGKP